ncbi:hypothetical protein CFP65_5454 [Kitasatospora sp. MMS16-BH015]|uniref:hypothetical protein n=1 Tax=Kitasatospora sp. MMS16-BH015 TaxID=2018025 RepID=UPI000CA3E5FF|nr:hypothetical protein [Kitasatospora sp. MMS16-BH015]AUG80156.1 hypothetical protein CFP65_5454 [Kitasatospora sp. MMS16-BH015]
MGSNSISGGTFHGPSLQAGIVQLGEQPVRPSGLPPRSVFVGRERQLAELAEALAAEGELVTVSAVAGLGGIGKTALAVEAAYRAQHLFPGGVLFIDLCGYDATCLSPDQALESLLHTLGQPVPPGLRAKEQLYRSCLAALPGPLLLVADNASAAAQVTPLLPGDPRHRVLVTSRHLLADRTLTPRHLTLDTLTEAESVALLTELAGPGAAYPELAELCGHLPLALRITAALLIDRPPARLVADLTDARERLTELDHSPDFAVRAAFDLSYRRLDPEEARLFALLPLNPGPDFALPAAAALANRPERESARLLRGLTRAHLLGRSNERYRLHDLVRLYAADCPVEGAEAARRRVIAYYVDTATAIQAGRADPNRPELSGWRAGQWVRLELNNLLSVWVDSANPVDGVDLGKLALDRLTLDTTTLFCALLAVSALNRFDGQVPLDLPVDLPASDTDSDATSLGRKAVELYRTVLAAENRPLEDQAEVFARIHEVLRLQLAFCRRFDALPLAGDLLLLLSQVELRLGWRQQAAAHACEAVEVFETVEETAYSEVARAYLATLLPEDTLGEGCSKSSGRP